MWTRDFPVPSDAVVLFQIYHRFAPLTRFQGPVWRLQVEQEVTLQAYLLPYNDQPGQLHVRRGPTVALRPPMFQVVGQMEAHGPEILPVEDWLAAGTLWWLRNLGSTLVVDTLRYALFAAHLQLNRRKFPDLHRALAYLDLLPLCNGEWISLEKLETHPHAFLALPRVSGPGWVEGRPVVRRGGLYAQLPGLTDLDLRPLQGEDWISDQKPLVLGELRLCWGGPVQPFPHLPQLRFELRSNHGQKEILDHWEQLLRSLPKRPESLADYCAMLLLKAWPDPAQEPDFDAIPRWAWDFPGLQEGLREPGRYPHHHTLHALVPQETLPIAEAVLTWKGRCKVFDHLPLLLGVRTRIGDVEIERLILRNWESLVRSLPQRKDLRLKYCYLLLVKAWPAVEDGCDLSRIPDWAWNFPGLHREYLKKYPSCHPLARLADNDQLSESDPEPPPPPPSSGHYHLSFRAGPAQMRFLKRNDGVCQWQAGEEYFELPLFPELPVSLAITLPAGQTQRVDEVRQAFLDGLDSLLYLLETYPQADREVAALKKFKKERLPG